MEEKGVRRTLPLRCNQVLLDESFIRQGQIKKLCGKRRFTLAHECAHQILYQMESDEVKQCCNRQYSARTAYSLRDLKTHEDWNEWQANVLGAAILMPQKEIDLAAWYFIPEKKLTSYDGYFTYRDRLSLRAICAQLGVSQSAAVIRLRQLGYLEDRPYFICGGNKSDKTFCSSHSIKESVVYDTVLAVVQGHIDAAMNMADALKQIDDMAWENREIEKIKAKISFQEEIIDKNRRLKTGAYEDFKSDFISREEYKAFTAQFDQQIKEASDTIMRLTSERNSVMGGLAEQQSWLEQFRKYANIKELTRSTVVNLIDYIHIRENKDIDVGLMHCDRFASIVEFLRERQEKEDANKVIRFERKVV